MTSYVLHLMSVSEENNFFSPLDPQLIVYIQLVHIFELTVTVYMAETKSKQFGFSAALRS